MILRTLLSHYRNHPVQGIFLLTGITIANVLLVGTLLINAQARASYQQGEQLLAGQPLGRIDHLESGQPISESDYVRLRRLGFDNVAPVLRRIVRTKGGEPLELLGVDAFAFPRMSISAEPSESREASAGFAGFPFPPYQLWAAPGRIEQLGWEPGQEVQLDNGDRLPPVVAVSDEQLGHRFLLDIGALQSLTGSEGEISYLAVFPDTNERIQALIESLPAGLELSRSEDAPDPAELTQSFHLNLAAMGLLAFVVGIFLTYNALAFSYTDRHELIRRLRLSGVTRKELRRGLVSELILFLLAGSALGFMLGAQLASMLLPGVGRTLAQLYGVYIAYPDALVPSGSWLPLAMTAVAATLCLLFPLRETLIAPLLERSSDQWHHRSVTVRDRRMLIVAVVMLAISFLLGRTASELWVALAGMACLLLGAALLLPSIVRWLLSVMARWLPDRFARASWLLADSKWLLGPASLALMAMTLALVANSGLNTMIGSFRQATDVWLEQRLAADLYLGVPSSPAEIQQWIGDEHPGLEMVRRYRTSMAVESPQNGRQETEVVSLQDASAFRDSVELLKSGPDFDNQFFEGDALYVSERAWRLDGWEIGDQVPLCSNLPGVPIAGVYHDYGNPQSQFMVSEALFERCWPSISPSGYAIVGPSGTDWAAVTADLTRQFGLGDNDIIDQGELRQIGMAVFDRTFVVTHALNALTLLVAGIGIFCAISAIHHHRVGHQALLASLGLSRRERAVLLLSQWGLFGLLCMVLVWPFGTMLAGYLAGVVTPVAFGWSFPLRLEWSHYLLLAVAASAALVLAVLVPSLRLLRTSAAAMLREQAT